MLEMSVCNVKLFKINILFFSHLAALILIVSCSGIEVKFCGPNNEHWLEILGCAASSFLFKLFFVELSRNKPQFSRWAEHESAEAESIMLYCQWSEGFGTWCCSEIVFLFIRTGILNFPKAVKTEKSIIKILQRAFSFIFDCIIIIIFF